MNILKLLEGKVVHALISAGAPATVSAMIRQSARANFGDYQCNAVMAVAKQLALPPRELAQRVIDNLQLGDIADKIEIAGPGFINIYIN